MSEEKKSKVNPFDEWVTYEMVVKELGTQKVATYYKGILDEDQINWITEEIENYKLNKTK